MGEKEIKKANKIFAIIVVGSATTGIVIGLLGYYWLGITLAYVGALSAVVYFSRVTAGQRTSDEMLEHINEKAAALAFAVTFILMGALLVVVTGLERADIFLPSSVVLGAFFAFISLFYVLCYHHYEKRSGG